MSSYTVVPIPGLPALLHWADGCNEVREVLKFLALAIAYMGRDNSPFGPKIFFDGQWSLYPAGSSIVLALKLFCDGHFAFFEGAVRTCLDPVFFHALSTQHDDPGVIQVKQWLIECTCAPAADPNNIVGPKLAAFRVPQPVLATLPLPTVVPPQAASNSTPEMARALLQLANDANARGVPMLEDEYFHILREFMRLAMNCGQVWRKYGPEQWNFVQDGMPVLSEQACYEGLMVVGETWRRMIENPFSDAPLHIRRILAQCDMIGAANHFLVNVQQPLNHSWPSLMSIDSLTRHFVMSLQWAAEEVDLERFNALRVTRLHSPFTGPYLPAPAASLNELEVRRQPPGTRFAIHGLPHPDVLELRDEADIILPHPTGAQLAAEQADFDGLLDLFFSHPSDSEDYEDDDDLEQAPLLDEDREVYRTERYLATPPQLVAVGPPYDPRQFGEQVQPSEFGPEDVCAICTCDLATDEDKNCIRLSCKHIVYLAEMDEHVNGVYWLQKAVVCPLCRKHICDSRPTQQVQQAVQLPAPPPAQHPAPQQAQPQALGERRDG